MTEQLTTPWTAEQILERGRTRRIVPVAGTDGALVAWGFTRQECKAYHDDCAKAAGSIEADAYQDERLVMYMIRDASGKPVFSETHITRLADLNEADFRPLLRACMQANGWGKDAEAEIRKNSDGRSGGSASGSQPQPGSVSASTT